MHLQLPDTLRPPGELAVIEGPAEAKGVVLDRVELHRRARKVKFYFRKNRCKRCYSDLSEEQITTVHTAIRKTGRVKAENFVFDDELYIVSPGTKRFVA